MLEKLTHLEEQKASLVSNKESAQSAQGLVVYKALSCSMISSAIDSLNVDVEQTLAAEKVRTACISI